MIVRQADQLSALMRRINESNGWQNSWILALVGSLGDSVCAISLMPEFQRRHQGNLTVILPAGHSLLLDAAGVRPHVRLHDDVNAIAQGCHEKVQALHEFFCPGIPTFCLPFLFGNLWRATVSGELKMLSMFKELLRLPPTASVGYFEGSRHPGAYFVAPRVLVSPLTRTNPMRGHEYWGTFCRLLKARHIDTDVNLSGAPERERASQFYRDSTIIDLDLERWFTTGDSYSAIVGHPTGLAVLQSMTRGEVPQVWVACYDPRKPFYLEKGYNLMHSTKLQDFLFQGVEAQRPMYQVNSVEMTAEDLADVVTDLVVNGPDGDADASL